MSGFSRNSLTLRMMMTVCPGVQRVELSNSIPNRRRLGHCLEALLVQNIITARN
jgi:hypothetical protein